MTTRMADRLFLAGFIVVGAYYLLHSFDLAAAFAGSGLGPGHFPIILGSLLIVLCLAQLVASFFGNPTDSESTIELPNVGKLALTIGLMAIFFLAWAATGLFYIPAGFFFFALVAGYSTERTIKTMAVAAAVAVVFTLSIFFVFDVALGVSLG